MDEPVRGVPGISLSPTASTPTFSSFSSVFSLCSTSPPAANLGRPGVGSVSNNSSLLPSSFKTATVSPLVLLLPDTLLADASAGEIQPLASPREGRAADQIDPAILVECRLFTFASAAVPAPAGEFKAEGLSERPRAAAVEPHLEGVVDGVKKPDETLTPTPPSAAAAVLIRGPGTVTRLGPRLSGRGGPRLPLGSVAECGAGAGAMTPPETLVSALPDRCGILYLPVEVDVPSGAELGPAEAVVGESPPCARSDGVMRDKSGRLNDTLRLCPFCCFLLSPLEGREGVLIVLPASPVASSTGAARRGDSAARCAAWRAEKDGGVGRVTRTDRAVETVLVGVLGGVAGAALVNPLGGEVEDGGDIMNGVDEGLLAMDQGCREGLTGTERMFAMTSEVDRQIGVGRSVR